jgi:hypothetical protein
VNKSEFTVLAECHLMYESKFTSVRTWMSCSKPASVVMGCLYDAIKKAPVGCCLEQSPYSSVGEVALLYGDRYDCVLYTRKINIITHFIPVLECISLRRSEMAYIIVVI